MTTHELARVNLLVAHAAATSVLNATDRELDKIDAELLAPLSFDIAALLQEAKERGITRCTTTKTRSENQCPEGLFIAFVLDLEPMPGSAPDAVNYPALGVSHVEIEPEFGERMQAAYFAWERMLLRLTASRGDR